MERKRPRIEEQEDGKKEKLAKTDLRCPICYDIFKAVQVTTCGHSFCHDCIDKCLKQTAECPVCKQSLPMNVKRFAPNFALNDVVAKIKSNEKCHIPMARSEVKYIVDLASKLDSLDFDILRNELDSKAKQIEEEDEEISEIIYKQFLDESQRRKELELQNIKDQLKALEKDKQKTSPTDRPPKPLSSEGESKKSHRSLQLHSNFDDIQDSYISLRNSIMEDQHSTTSSFQENLDAITRFSSFRELATLYYGDGPMTSSSIVSSIEFDKDGEFFAVGGVTRKIKIFEYGSVSSHQPKFNMLHYPVREIPCQAKLSSVCYNPYLKQQLAASDYDGALSIWDTQQVKCIHSYQEHEKRVWSLSYNSYDPALIATGGDDCSLKLWHLTKGQSIRSQPTRANVCSVRFQPGNRYNLAYGGADHMIRLIDVRNFSEPFLTLKGHRKAVSYVNFISDNELVSASTDSELKLWSTETGQCLRTFRGHVNEKNFVGLTVNNGYLSCGSENNSFYVYHKFVSQPILKYKFSAPHTILPGAQEQRHDESNDFVSSVCFRKDSCTILAANSHGYIKVLEMV